MAMIQLASVTRLLQCKGVVFMPTIDKILSVAVDQHGDLVVLVHQGNEYNLVTPARGLISFDSHTEACESFAGYCQWLED